MTYIDKDKALNLDFRINVKPFESRRKTAEFTQHRLGISLAEAWR